MSLRLDLSSYLPERPAGYWSQTYGYPPVVLVSSWYQHLAWAQSQLSPFCPHTEVRNHSNDFAVFGYGGSCRCGKAPGYNGIEPGAHRVPEEVDAVLRMLATDMGMALGAWDYQAVSNGTFATARVELVRLERVIAVKGASQYALW